MTCFAFSLTLLVATSLNSAFATVRIAGGIWDINPRTLSKHSTLGSRKAFEYVGSEIYISPSDRFDFVPTAGYNDVVEKVENYVADLVDNHEHIAIVKKSVEWAKSAGLEGVGKVVLTPNESLVGKVLKIESSKPLFKAEGMCYLLDVGHYDCHTPNDVEVVEVTVAPYGKPSVLWVACHNEDIESGYTCHVMNVGYVVFAEYPRNAGGLRLHE